MGILVIVTTTILEPFCFNFGILLWILFFFFLYLVSLYLAVFELSSLAMELRFLSEKKKTFHILIPRRIVKQFWFSFSFWNCAVERTRTRLKKAQRCASFLNLTDGDLTPASSSVSLPGSFSILLTHMGTVQLGYVHICSISVAAMIINVFSSSAKLLMHVCNSLFCFRGRERSHSFNAVDLA